MKKQLHIVSISSVFSQWSRKNYAVFAGLGKQIKISRVSADISDLALLKTNSCKSVQSGFLNTLWLASVYFFHILLFLKQFLNRLVQFVSDNIQPEEYFLINFICNPHIPESVLRISYFKYVTSKNYVDN